MVNLEEMLLKNQGIKNFREYVNRLTGEEIYVLFCCNADTASMKQAQIFLRDLGAKLKLKHDAYLEAINKLSQQWSGASAEQAVNRLLGYAVWLRQTASVAWQTGLRLFLILEDRAAICAQMVLAENFEENRATVLELREREVAGEFASKIALLDEQYMSWEALNHKYARRYYRKIAEHMSKLQSWPEAPEDMRSANEPESHLPVKPTWMTDVEYIQHLANLPSPRT